MANNHKLSRANRELLGWHAKRRRTELGIAIAHALSPPRRRWTLDEIALFAGCTEAAIMAIEQRALKHLRKHLSGDPFFRNLKSDLANAPGQSVFVRPPEL